MRSNSSGSLSIFHCDVLSLLIGILTQSAVSLIGVAEGGSGQAAYLFCCALRPKMACCLFSKLFSLAKTSL